MNVTVESTGALERRMRVEVPIERIENEVKSRLQSVGKTARVKGFRPGKVPARVVRQKYGKQIRQEVLGEIMQRSYTDAVVQEKLKPAGGPRIETEGEDDKNFTYVATFEVLPEVELKDLDKIKVDKPEIEIRDEDIEDMLLELACKQDGLCHGKGGSMHMFSKEKNFFETRVTEYQTGGALSWD